MVILAISYYGDPLCGVKNGKPVVFALPGFKVEVKSNIELRKLME
jgi:hypothetical protein